MNVLVIDGQGGGLGRQLVAAISAACPEARLTAVGTNSLATSAMLKAGTVRAATGENAVVVNCRTADVIVGPIGIVIADALMGEITPAMAAAVCQSPARRVLVPINHCDMAVEVLFNPYPRKIPRIFLICCMSRDIWLFGETRCFGKRWLSCLNWWSFKADYRQRYLTR